MILNLIQKRAFFRKERKRSFPETEVPAPTPVPTPAPPPVSAPPPLPENEPSSQDTLLGRSGGVLQAEKLALDSQELRHVPAFFITFRPHERIVDGCVRLRYRADPPERFRQRCVDPGVVREKRTLEAVRRGFSAVFSIPHRCCRAQ